MKLVPTLSYKLSYKTQQLIKHNRKQRQELSMEQFPIRVRDNYLISANVTLKQK